MKLPNSYEAMQPDTQFYMAFLECMLWSSCADVEEHENMDDLYSISDIDQQSADMIKSLCDEFIEKAGNDSILEHNYSQAGHDFWLTIAGHGAGFWDGDWSENGDKLTAICEEWINDVMVYSDGVSVFCDVGLIGRL